ncbi:hypothetical protein BY996DRAFT_6480005 [Phakopsora pachyrhizi]|nr:hypothetical protein BY996DRAFT_6480005 [Phakopsora pachyrhizi]
MLHTDAFNKNNWVKMTRSDYVKNTKIDGIPSEVIEVCSPISQTWKAVFLQFIFVDEDKDVEKSRPKEACTYQGSSTSLSAKPATSANLKALISASKVNPYQLISDGLTDELSPNIESLIPSQNPFSFTGAVPYFDFKKLRKSLVISLKKETEHLLKHHLWIDAPDLEEVWCLCALRRHNLAKKKRRKAWEERSTFETGRAPVQETAGKISRRVVCVNLDGKTPPEKKGGYSGDTKEKGSGLHPLVHLCGLATLKVFERKTRPLCEHKERFLFCF